MATYLGDLYIEGTAGADRLTGTGQGDLIRGLDGPDILYGFTADEFMTNAQGQPVGPDPSLTMFGSGDDTIYGEGSNDVLWGGGGGVDRRGGCRRQHSPSRKWWAAPASSARPERPCGQAITMSRV